MMGRRSLFERETFWDRPKAIYGRGGVRSSMQDANGFQVAWRVDAARLRFATLHRVLFLFFRIFLHVSNVVSGCLFFLFLVMELRRALDKEKYDRHRWHRFLLFLLPGACCLLNV